MQTNTLPKDRQPPVITHESLRAQARSILDRLAARAMPASTSHALESALRYWAAWHLASFGEPLGLTKAVPEPVPADSVLIFIAHHAAIAMPGADSSTVAVRTGMPDVVRAALLQAVPQAGHRRVSLRNDGAVEIDPDVPAVKTVIQRVSLLGTLHERMGLPRPQCDQRIGRTLAHLRRATARTAPAALPHSKLAIQLADVQAMLDGCSEEIRAGGRAGWIAMRDRALLLAGFGSGRRRAEIARMSLEHLQPGSVRLANGRKIRCIWWHLYELKGRVSERGDTPLLSLPLVGPARIALLSWLQLLTMAGIDKGSVWRTIRPGQRIRNVRTLVAKSMPPEAITTMVKRRMELVLRERLSGLRNSDAAAIDIQIQNHIKNIGAHSLRSGFITSSLEIGLRPDDIAKMSAHSDPRSFRIYDQRGLNGNPAINLIRSLKIR